MNVSRAACHLVTASLALAACETDVRLGAHDRFATLPPGATLPSAGECARRLRPVPEQRPGNAAANRTSPTAERLDAFHAESWDAEVDPRAQRDMRLRIDGALSGTTDEILQAGACKWGLDEDLVRAFALVASDWRQPMEGTWRAGDCPAGYTPDATGRCPQAFGIMQVRFNSSPSTRSTFPSSRDSTGFSVDYMLGWMRACFEGYIHWLDDAGAQARTGARYGPGDDWGCFGFYYSGQWYDPSARDYVTRLRAARDARAWARPGF